MADIDETGSIISEIYGSHRSFFCFYAMGYVDSYAEAEDIVHSVFEKVLSRNVDIKDPDALRSYLLAAVRNSCLNHITHQKVHGKYASHILSENEFFEDKGYINSRIEAEILWEVFSKIEQLPDGCRQIFRLSYLEDMSNQEIADRLGISVNTVKSQKARSKDLLKESLKDLFAIAAIIFGL